MSVCSDGSDNLYVSDLNRISKIVYTNYMYYARIIAGNGGSAGTIIITQLKYLYYREKPIKVIRNYIH